MAIISYISCFQMMSLKAQYHYQQQVLTSDNCIPHRRYPAQFTNHEKNK